MLQDQNILLNEIAELKAMMSDLCTLIQSQQKQIVQLKELYTTTPTSTKEALKEILAPSQPSKKTNKKEQFTKDLEELRTKRNLRLLKKAIVS